ncbi:MAG: Rpn family recombination-promoting nuclease/putative transposase [Turicibacter sp.]|nr:Rpn family recombination-promoting nuclease/putative transposase [Turicibacter sp.]
MKNNRAMEIFMQITNQLPPPTSAEIAAARGELSIMNDRVFTTTFADNKHNDIITGTINAVRKIHAAPLIPPIEHTQVQTADIFDVLMRGMIGDLTGAGDSVSIAVEAQAQKQDGYAVRGIITTSNAMRKDFKIGEDYTQAPTVITLHFLGFKLPELAVRKMFCSRIVNAEFESGKPFLADKYSTYFIELPKMANFKKADLPPEYHDLWDLCCIFRSRVKKIKEEIKMQEIINPIALKLGNAVQETVTPDSFVEAELKYRRGFDKFQDYMTSQKEELVLIALKSNAQKSLVETMCKAAGITKSRLAELQKLAQA